MHRYLSMGACEMANPKLTVAVERSACCAVLVAPLDASAASELAKGFAALGDPVRLRILSLLAVAPSGEMCVCEFMAPLGKSQGTVSHHLKVLGDAGLVEGDRRGKWVWYRLVADRLAALEAAIASP